MLERKYNFHCLRDRGIAVLEAFMFVSDSGTKHTVKSKRITPIPQQVEEVKIEKSSPCQSQLENNSE